MRLAVTGVDGFVGRHVAAIAARRGHEVIGISRNGGAEVPGASEIVQADLTEEWPNLPYVDRVIHLAGLAAVGPSFDRPIHYLRANAAMVVNMCEALLRGRSVARVITSSTGAIYAPSEAPISETSPLAYTSPYAVSKAAVENMLSYYSGLGVDSIVTRPFNHIGPGQGPGYLVPDLLGRLRHLRDGAPLEVGNLAAARDYTDVRDVAAAYVGLAEADRPSHNLYNVASGEARTGHEVLAAICAALGREAPATRVTASRPLDVPTVTGDATRLRADLGWAPRYTFAESIADAVAEG
jgi:GDP-4-dehydro-6-deoxy-D-mannose reductase